MLSVLYLKRFVGVSREFQVGFRRIKGFSSGYMYIFKAHFSPTLSILYLFIAKKDFREVSGGFRGFQVGFMC